MLFLYRDSGLGLDRQMPVFVNEWHCCNSDRFDCLPKYLLPPLYLLVYVYSCVHDHDNTKEPDCLTTSPDTGLDTYIAS